MAGVPNRPDVEHGDQAEPDAVDWEILARASALTGVISGCAVTAQGSPDMTVAVAAGSIISGGVLRTVSSGNVTIAAADSTYDRFDLVVIDSSGTKQRRGGLASSNPVFPMPSAGDVVLAAVRVPAGATSVNGNKIVDKRVFAKPSVMAVRKSATETVNNSSTLQDDDHLVLPLLANEVWAFRCALFVTTDGTRNIKFAFTVPAGASLRWHTTGKVQDQAATSTGQSISVVGPTHYTAWNNYSEGEMVTLDGTVVNGANAGNLQLQWAQAIAGGVDSKVLVNSKLEALRVA